MYALSELQHIKRKYYCNLPSTGILVLAGDTLLLLLVVVLLNSELDEVSGVRVGMLCLGCQIH